MNIAHEIARLKKEAEDGSNSSKHYWNMYLIKEAIARRIIITESPLIRAGDTCMCAMKDFLKEGGYCPETKVFIDSNLQETSSQPDCDTSRRHGEHPNPYPMKQFFGKNGGQLVMIRSEHVDISNKKGERMDRDEKKDSEKYPVKVLDGPKKNAIVSLNRNEFDYIGRPEKADELDDEVKKLYTGEKRFDITYDNPMTAEQRGHTGTRLPFMKYPDTPDAAQRKAWMHLIELANHLFDQKDKSHVGPPPLNPLTTAVIGGHSLTAIQTFRAFGQN